MATLYHYNTLFSFEGNMNLHLKINISLPCVIGNITFFNGTNVNDVIHLA